MLHTLNQKNPTDSLIVFNNFIVDENLPRFKKPSPSQVVTPDGRPPAATGQVITAFGTATGNFFISTAGTTTAAMQQIYVNDGSWAIRSNTAEKPPIIKRIWSWLRLKKTKLVEKMTEVKVEYVFERIMKDAEALKIFDERMEKHLKLIENAKNAGQVALVEKLNREIELRKYENALIACGVTKRVTEKQLLEFTALCNKNLALDWIKNFARPIPQEVLDLKAKADDAGLFDNYVILHYDPEKRGSEMTDAEKERAKDPILFGVMRASRNLYFVADWKDEQCSLTLEDIVEHLNHKLNIP